jgi:hypothetical protein
MTTNLTNNEISTRQSTYSLLVRSEEKQRSFFETAIYALFILCAVFPLWQFAQTPVTIPAHLGATERVAVVAPAVEARS